MFKHCNKDVEIEGGRGGVGLPQSEKEAIQKYSPNKRNMKSYGYCTQLRKM